jgi:hypothetical protein
MKKALWAFFLLLPMYCQADDDSTVILDSENYDQQMCVQRTADDCVNTICPNSEARDCTDKCQADAEEKCQVGSDKNFN